MAVPPEFVQLIRNELAKATSAIRLSDKLFSPGGLFSQLATTEAERRDLVQTPLFKQAQSRMRQLQKAELARFTKSIDASQAVPQ